MLDSQTTRLLIGVLFLIIAYLMDKPSAKNQKYIMYSFAGIGALVLIKWWNNRDDGFGDRL